MSRISETIYVAVLYKSVESKYYHIEQCLREGGTYMGIQSCSKVFKGDIEWKYHYINATYLEEVINNLCGTAFNGAKFLHGDYDSEVINYVLTRVRRKAI